MVDVSVDVPSPLQECFLHCETLCVSECCGIDAIATDAELIAQWAHEAGPKKVAEAQRQLASLIDTIQDRSHNVSSTFLNHYTCDEAARIKLLEFLEAFRNDLAAMR